MATEAAQADAVRAVLEKLDDPVRRIAIGFLNDLEAERDRLREAILGKCVLCAKGVPRTSLPPNPPWHSVKRPDQDEWTYLPCPLTDAEIGALGLTSGPASEGERG